MRSAADGDNGPPWFLQRHRTDQAAYAGGDPDQCDECISELDVDCLAAYCQSFMEYVRLINEIKEDGIMVHTDKGMILNPLIPKSHACLRHVWCRRDFNRITRNGNGRSNI